MANNELGAEEGKDYFVFQSEPEKGCVLWLGVLLPPGSQQYCTPIIAISEETMMEHDEEMERLCGPQLRENRRRHARGRILCGAAAIG
jgi:hypothetical protein